MKSLHKRLSIIAVVVLTLFTMFFTIQRPAMPKNNNILRMQAPSFVTKAQAGNSEIGTLLDNEAGISAYFKSSTPIDLNQVKSEFRTIEQETTDYIIGSVPVPNYVEEYDVHVYVHKDGWILAYYLKGDPAIKIVDLKGKTVTTTNLKTVVQIVAIAAGSAFTDVTYYDFRYPNATNLLIVAEDWENGADFTITLPSDFGYFERSWGEATTGSNKPSLFQLDGVDLLKQATWYGDKIYYGELTASQMFPDITHSIAIDASGVDLGYGSVVIIYRGQ